MSAADLEQSAVKQNFVKMNRALINADEGDDDVDEDDPSKIYMELESTQGALADVDIDAMFKSTSVDEFMRQISRRGTFSGEQQDQPKQRQTQDAMEMISSIMSGQKLDDQGKKVRGDAPKLEFGDQIGDIQSLQDEAELRSKAMQNLRERRMRLK